MATVYRAFGFRFMIFLNDHEPAHVHVFGQGGEAKITLTGPDGVVVDRATGISRADLRRILSETREHREMLVTAWEQIHG
jgi:hypothetical protein